MAIALGVQIIGIKDVVARLKKLDDEQKAIVYRAVNDTAKYVITLGVRGITGEWNVTGKTVRDTFTITPASRSRPEATVTSRGKPIGLIKFGAKQTRRGVTYRIKKATKKRSVLSRGFIATMRSGHIGAFLRRGKPRLPIIERSVISPPSMWRQRLDEQLPMASAYLRKRIEQRIRWAAERR